MTNKELSPSDIICGRNAVETFLSSENSACANKILFAKGIKHDSKLNNIIQLAKKHKIQFKEVPKENLNSYTNEVHQGVIAFISPIKYTEFSELIENIKNKTTNSLLVILDSVHDPHNLGAIIRTAKCAGADGIIIPKRRSAVVTSTVFKSSAGAASLLPIVQVPNLNQAIKKLKENNIWIIGVEASGDTFYYDLDLKMNCAIVLGGENEGISNLVSKNCDFITKIPMPGEFNSLNVSNAASIVVYEFVRQNFL